ncbi:MAG: 2-C-methyl-D-erythritol 2,4-cyclodiphosphate synthase [Acidimicrobiales bacterium]
MRVGHGFDSHQFETNPDRPLVLGGVVFDTDLSLVGHSDADVVAHACADALAGPAGLGDIGSWFPDDEPEFEDANSLVLLAEIVAAVRGAGFVVVNIDCSVVAEQPKLAPKREIMQSRLSEVVGAPVTVKGKRPEGLGLIDGIACWAVAMLDET